MEEIKGKIKAALKSNKLTYSILYPIWHVFHYITCYYKFVFLTSYRFKKNRFLYKHNLCHRFDAIKSYKGKYAGRCFIIATGPSLTVEDFNKLKDEVTIGMNSLVKWFPKVGWETTFYGIQDDIVFNNLRDDVCGISKSIIFYNFNLYRQSKDYYKRLRSKQNSVEYPLYLADHCIKLDSTKGNKFSEDASDIVYDGHTIAYSLLQIAVYMGFSKIYLIGTDCNYQGEVKHAIDNGVKHSEDQAVLYALGNQMIKSYVLAKEFADKHNVEIYNATRGGKLEVFPRVDLDEVLKNKQ